MSHILPAIIQEVPILTPVQEKQFPHSANIKQATAGAAAPLPLEPPDVGHPLHSQDFWHDIRDKVHREAVGSPPSSPSKELRENMAPMCPRHLLDQTHEAVRVLPDNVHFIGHVIQLGQRNLQGGSAKTRQRQHGWSLCAHAYGLRLSSHQGKAARANQSMMRSEWPRLLIATFVGTALCKELAVAGCTHRVIDPGASL